MTQRTGGTEGKTPTRRTWLRFRIGYLVIMAAMTLFGFKFVHEAWADHQSAQRVAAAQAAINTEIRSIDQLRAKIAQAQAPDFIQEQARVWGYVKHGEGLVSINFLRPRPIQHITRPVVKHSATPVWQQWWNAFFGS